MGDENRAKDMMYKNDQRRIIDAKLVMDNLVADTQGYFSELGIDQRKMFDAWMALDDIIKSESLDYKSNLSLVSYSC